MKYIKLIIDLILVACGVLFLANIGSDIQFGFGIIMVGFGLSDLVSLKMYWKHY
jgi:hypothetical protein